MAILTKCFFPYLNPTSYLNIISKGLSTDIFCHAWWILSIKQKLPTSRPLFLRDNNNIKCVPMWWVVYQTKSNEKYIPFYIIFQVLKVLLIKICKIEPPDLLLIVLISFYITEIIFHKFLEIHSTLFGKKIFVTIFPFFNRFTNPHPLNSQKSTKRDKSFLLMLPALTLLLTLLPLLLH